MGWRIGLSFCITAMLLSDSKAAGDGPSEYLDQVSIISYFTIIEKNNDAGKCRIDWDAWDTALQFVANQSARLKIITQKDHTDTSEAKRRALPRPDFGKDGKPTSAHEAATREWTKYLYMPFLLLDVTPIEMGNGCVGTLRASLTAAIEPSRIIATGAFASRPEVEIWSQSFWFKSPYSDFTGLAIRMGEQAVKGLVNDWTKSQH